MSSILAIDPASYRCGIAVFEDGILQFTSTLVSAAETPLKRRLDIAVKIHSLIDQYDITVSEEPMLQGRNNNGMQRLLGMFEFGDPEIQFIHPLTIKKSITGSGKAEKIDVAIAAGAMLETESEKEIMAEAVTREAWDETDAVAIGLAYLRRVN